MSSIALAAASPATAQVQTYTGICDASAGVALDDQHFVVADDESNVLRVYTTGVAEPEDLSIRQFLDSNKESDLEGAAVIGDRIYWITSFGRNKSGEVQERRYRFFATGFPVVEPVETFNDTLLAEMIAAPTLKDLPLQAGSLLAPEDEGGFNIEGLAAYGEAGLLIAFRNPIPDGEAIVVPLTNPAEVIAGKPAVFGEPERLNLGGNGIRSLERIGDGYLIVAGPPGDDGTFALYRWIGPARDGESESGQDQEARKNPAPIDNVSLGSLRPEALFAIGDAVRLLSDDGGVEVDGEECKDLDDDARKSFRSMDIQIPPS